MEPPCKCARRAPKSLEDVFPGGPAGLVPWLCPWTDQVPKEEDEGGIWEADRMIRAGVCDNAGFHAVRDLLHLASANRCWNQLRFPARNANEFADQCHKDFCEQCRGTRDHYLEVPKDVERLDEAALKLLPRREERLVLLAKAVGAESAAMGYRVVHANCSGQRLADDPREPLQFEK